MMQRGETPEPCEDIAYGEVEDYSINIKPIIVGIEEQKLISRAKPELIVYPNPTNGMFTLNIYSNTTGSIQMDLVNSAGQVVKQKQLRNHGIQITEQLDISGLPNGMYYLVARTEQGSISQARIIKE